MKRLKNKLLSMETNTTTYAAMYDGSMSVVDPAYPSMPPVMEYDPTYYHEDVGFFISTTHKLAQDKPTVTVSIPCERLGIGVQSTAAADFCLREFKKIVEELNEDLYNRARPDYENGKYYLPDLGGEILVRNAAFFAMCPQKDYENGSGSTVYIIHDGVKRERTMCLCFRLQVQLPRRKLRKTIQMLCHDLPDAVDRFLEAFDIVRFAEAMALAEKQAAIRAWLRTSDYCAFVANGSILPRAKGTQLPMENAVPFCSVPDDEIEICGVRGMGIRRGVTVITGGGYSGKSTLLDAISAGVYDHVLGDGRELCITDNSAVTISAEDGRSVKHVNVSPFIKWLPGGDTRDFSTDHASGSTSQAANIMEAVEVGARLLLIDEDKSATNFMIRDRMMKALIEKEPITPFTDRVGELFGEGGVSTILVIGGSGEYLSVADKIYMMEDYRIHNVSARARDICRVHGIEVALPAPADWSQERILYAEGFSSYPEASGSERLAVSNMGIIFIGDEKLDVRGLHDLVSPYQLDALGFMLRYLAVSNNERIIALERQIDGLYQAVEKEGLDFIYSSFFTTCERFLDLPRKCELMAAVYRMRKIQYVKGGMKI